MAKDASFETISEVRPHPNADKLEIATICGWKVIIGKGEFKAGDVVFYIREDAKLAEYDRNHELEGWKWPWQEPLLKYLGTGGRVKTVRLRGEYSCGIAIAVDKVFSHINAPEAKDWQADNKKLDGEYAGAFLQGKYGVSHWQAPIGNVGDNSAVSKLPPGIPKSDEENVQNLKDYEIPYGEKALVTKKLDGTSCTIIVAPHGGYHVCSRSNDLLTTADNVWNRAAKPVIPLALAWAKHYNRTLVLRGEVCAPSVQRFSFNHDKDVSEPTFFCYGVLMLDEHDYALHNGLYGTKYHFTEIAKQIKELTGFELKTVPVLGEETVSKELFDKYMNMPLDWGEGVVINTTKNHFKCKSLAYLAALSKK